MKCEICGKEIEQSDYSNATLCSKECYNAHYWLTKYKEYIAKDEDRNPPIVYKGVCYTIGEQYDKVRGFCGKKFKIIPSSELNVYMTPYITDNLWSNGPIPPAFRELMPDNVLSIEEVLN